MAQMVQKGATASTQKQTTPANTKTEQEGAGRLTVFLHALAFVAGFTLVFTLLGSAAGLIGQNLNSYVPIIQQVGAILLVIFALTTMGVFRWLVGFISERVDVNANPAVSALVSILNFFNSLLYTEKRVTDMHQVNRGWGFLSSGLLGVSFSAGWVPCVGPILASIFFLASDSSTAGQGAALLAIYSLGLGIPFLLTGAAFSTATKTLRRLNRHLGVISFISGVFLLYVAYLLWSGTLASMAGNFVFLSELAYGLEDQLTVASGTGGDIFSMSFLSAAPLALLAGLISFLSPCVLPLVPAYIGYLSGTALGSSRS